MLPLNVNWPGDRTLAFDTEFQYAEASANAVLVIATHNRQVIADVDRWAS